MNYFKKVIWGILLGSLISVATFSETEKDTLLSQMIIQSINSFHLKPQKIDDTYSKRVYDLFLDKIDPNKQILTKEDHKKLRTYIYKLDDDLQNGDFNFLNLSFTLYQNQLKKLSKIPKLVKNNEAKLKSNETIMLNSDHRKVANSEIELKSRWIKLIRLETLQNYLKAFKEKHKGNETVQLSLDEELFSEAQEKTNKSFNRRLKQLQNINKKEFYNRFFDVIAQSHGPHSNYLPPAEKENFDIGMTGKLEGIGAVLREDDGNIKIVRIIPGSASWRQKELKAEDIILKVGQGNKEPVDLIEMPVNDAVKYIRGKKGTEVRLTVKKPDGTIKVIPIIRDVVIVEETFAKAAIIEDKNTRIGYTYLPGFYRDFKNKTERNASSDINKILKQFNTKKVDGVILDLRNNGGGALEDAVLMSGHFIKSGPIVHIVDKNKNSRVLRDLNPQITYNGPLIVLVNQFSASASEILAAALQDYQRAIIIGTKNSFGKGTVQAIINLDHYLPRKYSGFKPLGSMKMTIQKFFRINGNSTQVYGVVPNIILPSSMDHLEVGEKTLEYSQTWKPVKTLSYKSWDDKPNVMKLKRLSKKRVQNTEYFTLLSDYNTFIELNKNKEESLDATTLWNEQQKIEAITKRLETIGKEQETTPNYSFTSIIPLQTQEERRKEFESELKKDVTLNEVLNIMKDMVRDYDSRHPKRNKVSTL